jgi:hypothetical protein
MAARRRFLRSWLDDFLKKPRVTDGRLYFSELSAFAGNNYAFKVAPEVKSS